MSLTTAGIHCTISQRLSGAMEDCFIVRAVTLLIKFWDFFTWNGSFWCKFSCILTEILGNLLLGPQQFTCTHVLLAAEGGSIEPVGPPRYGPVGVHKISNKTLVNLCCEISPTSNAQNVVFLTPTDARWQFCTIYQYWVAHDAFVPVHPRHLLDVVSVHRRHSISSW